MAASAHHRAIADWAIADWAIADWACADLDLRVIGSFAGRVVPGCGPGLGGLPAPGFLSYP